MNAFDEACKVETESRKILEPILDLAAYKGRYVWNGKGRLAKELQAAAGDILLNADADTVFAIELKAERKSSENLFLEAWSNRKEFNPGWMWKSNADFLLYHFLSSDDLYCFDFQKLKRWFHDCPNHSRPPWTQWRQALQGKYEQRNDTWGVLVPIERIGCEIGFDLLHPLNNLTGTTHRPSGVRAPMQQVRLNGNLERPQRVGPGMLDEYLGRP
jgi:hypothetical protein